MESPPLQPPLTTTTTTTLTSTTAPGKIFDNRSQLAEHYKSDWHKYNLKRREAGLPLLKESDFQARLEAALALRREREQRQERSGTDHLKHHHSTSSSNLTKAGTTKSKKKNKPKNKNGSDGGRTLGTAKTGTVTKSQAQASEIFKTQSTTPIHEHQDEQDQVMDDHNDNDNDNDNHDQPEEEPPTIEPRQCLFDKHVSATVEDNLTYMNHKYGFFVPDREFLIDPEGLVGYCHEKIKLGHMCLYCQKTFRTWQACQRHMVNTRHTKLLYERGQDLDEFDPFYDFSAANQDFLQSSKLLRKTHKTTKTKTKTNEEDDPMEEGNDDEEEEEGEWEDVTDDEDMEHIEEDDDDDDDGIYAGYEEEVAKYGFDVTPLGELVFPDGRIVGHRGLSRYYKQRAPSSSMDRTAVVAARRAAGERLWKGRVYDTAAAQGGDGTHETSLALARAGIAPGTATGRAGNGILVASKGGGFTALSLYRYKAVVKKARREEFQGQRLQHRTRLNMNRMDKKANRLHNNVSVAHAKR